MTNKHPDTTVLTIYTQTSLSLQSNIVISSINDNLIVFEI